MRLKTKLLLGFLTLAGMLLIAGAWSIYALNSVGASVQGLLDDNYASINSAEQMQEALERQDSGVLLLLLGNWQEGREILSSAENSFQEALEHAEGNLTIPGEVEYVERIRVSYGAYREVWQRSIAGTETEGDLEWYFSEAHLRFLEAKEAIRELKRINETSLYQTASELKGRAERAVLPGAVAAVAALVFSVLFSYLVHRFMIGPITRITRATEQFRTHRTEFDVEVATDDEIAELAESVRSLCFEYEQEVSR